MATDASSRQTTKAIPEWLNALPAIADLGPHAKQAFTDLLVQASQLKDFDVQRGVVLVRCPGRYSDYGSHTDYKACGGPVCGTASDEAVYGLFQARPDDQVVLHNTDPTFETKRFPTAATRAGLALGKDWNDWDRWTAEQYQKAGGDPARYGELAWDKYIRGLLFLLSGLSSTNNNADGAPGFTALFSSDLSHRGGMSSSSALVLSAALGLDALFDFAKPDPDAWIDLIGLSEWYVMTRGGCSDHARIFYSRKDHFVLVGSFPTSLLGEAPIPPNLVRVVVHSGVDRPQDDQTRNAMRVGGAGYALAMLFIKQHFPQFREELEAKDTFYHMGNLREFTSISALENKVSLAFLYDEVLRKLPASANREQIRRALPDYHEELGALFANHAAPVQGYPIRDIAVFGLAEIERTISFMDACRQGDFSEILRLVRLSQDGDRVCKSTLKGMDWTTEGYRFNLSDAMLDDLVKVAQDNPNAPEAQIRYLPGRFERSIPAMDQLADTVDAFLPNDAAIRVMGAGKGGNMHAMVREEKVDQFLSIIQEKYFRDVAGIQKPTITVLKGAAEGARVLSV